jgi:S1-C subfamily serine protease
MKTAVILAALIMIPAMRASDLAEGVNYGAVARIECGEAVGTGFWVESGRIVTAAHVVSNGPCSIDGVAAETARVDGDLDIAELHGPVGSGTLPIECSDYRTGRVYRAIGHALGALRPSTRVLRATRYRSDLDNGHRLRVFEGEVAPGMSGGPIVDNQGKVVGITLRRWPARSRELNDTWICNA